MKVWYARGAFILGFMDGIIDEQSNIIILKYYIGDVIRKSN